MSLSVRISFNLYIYLSPCLQACLSVGVYVCLLSFYISVCSSVRLSVCVSSANSQSEVSMSMLDVCLTLGLCVCLSVNLLLFVSISLSVCPSVSFSVHLFVCLHVCLFICPSVRSLDIAVDGIIDLGGVHHTSSQISPHPLLLFCSWPGNCLGSFPFFYWPGQLGFQILLLPSAPTTFHSQLSFTACHYYSDPRLDLHSGRLWERCIHWTLRL